MVVSKPDKHFPAYPGLKLLIDLTVRAPGLFGDLEIRLFRGFFLNLNGNSSLIRDQIYLPARGATDEEILVRQRQLATDFEWRFRIGITYSFGSIFNNVVNSRFAGSSGGFIRAF